MKNIHIHGGHLITPLDERFADLLIEGEHIKKMGDFQAETGWQSLDASDCYVTPGLFDLQVNGSKDCDLWEIFDKNEINKLGKSLLNAGVTSYLPTLITGDISHLKKNVAFLANEIGLGLTNNGKSSEILPRAIGIHLEGPCISPEKPGVHPPQFIQPLKLEILKELIQPGVKLITLAPELDKSGKCLKELVDKGIIVSLGHSNANFEEAQTAFQNGVRLVTHTFNAMPGIHHRQPGATTAALINNQVYCAMICDGMHIAAPIAELIIKLKGVKKTILVTDISKIGTSQGNLVGSSILLNEAVINVVNWGIATFAQAIYMASYNPARAMGVDNSIGHLQEGKYADIVLWNKKTLAIEHVIVGGKLVF